ncbi:MAG: HAMP domain-containing histidine kinase [Myxococcales bacterium]|nr:HAMP domain-containing histidine kinase [Myxococcales bacterium]
MRSLAEESSGPVPRRRAVQAVATTFLGRRPFILLPLFVTLAGSLAWFEGPSARPVLAATLGTLALGFFFWEAARGRRRTVTDAELWRSLAITLAFIGVVTLATGGATSPLALMLFAPTVIGFAAFGRGRRSDALFLLACAVVVLTALAPPGVPFPALPDDMRRLLLVVAGASALVLLRVGVTALSDAHRAARDAAVGAGDELVAAAEARGQALEAMGARVAHEVKNPLSAIRGLVEVMGENATSDRDKKRLGVVLGEVDRIDEILRGYLALTRPLEQIERRRADVARLVREVAAVTEGRAERAGVTITVEAEPIAWDLDDRRIKEAILNLVLNALDASEAGGRVTIRSAATHAALALSVTDTGRGMDEAELARAGSPYWTKKRGGTGLGVALARRVAEGHGGRLEVESRPGHGTRMTLVVPRAEGP